PVPLTKNPVWQQALKACADPPRAKHFLELFAVTTARATLEICSAEQARILTALFSGSQVLGNMLVAHPDWLDSLLPEVLGFPRRKQGLLQETVNRIESLIQARDYPAALSQLREFKSREMLRIAARDLARLGQLP